MKAGIASTVGLILCLTTLPGYSQKPNPGVMKNRFGEGEPEKQAASGHESSSLSGSGMMAKIITSDAFAEKLGLSEAQAKELKDGILDLRKKEIQLKADLEIAGEEQARLMTEDKTDDSAVIKAVEKAGKIKTDMAVIKVRQLLLVKNVLNPEQRKKMRQMLRTHVDQAVEARRGRDGGQGQNQQEGWNRDQHKSWLQGRSGRDGKNRWGKNDATMPVGGMAGRDGDNDNVRAEAPPPPADKDAVSEVETGSGRGGGK